MPKYAIYSPQGEILRSVVCAETEIANQLNATEQYIETDIIDGYVEHGTVHHFPEPRPEPFYQYDVSTKAWVDPRSVADLLFIARIDRDELLAQTDWTQLPDVPDTTRTKYQAYRQALRDVPQQSGFPTDIDWPTKPE